MKFTNKLKTNVEIFPLHAWIYENENLTSEPIFPFSGVINVSKNWISTSLIV